MREEYKNLLKAPWSNQKVGPFIRFLAWIFVVCAVVAFVVMGYFLILEGIPKEYILPSLVVVGGEIYLMLLFGRVAIKGQAPSGWLPWK